MFKLDDLTSWYPGIPVKGGWGVGDRVWYGGDDRVGLGLQIDGYQQLQALAISHRHRFADGNRGRSRAQQLLSPDRISGGGVDLPCNPGTPHVRSGWWEGGAISMFVCLFC